MFLRSKKIRILKSVLKSSKKSPVNVKRLKVSFSNCVKFLAVQFLSKGVSRTGKVHDRGHDQSDHQHREHNQHGDRALPAAVLDEGDVPFGGGGCWYFCRLEMYSAYFADALMVVEPAASDVEACCLCWSACVEPTPPPPAPAPDTPDPEPEPEPEGVGADFVSMLAWVLEVFARWDWCSRHVGGCIWGRGSKNGSQKKISKKIFKKSSLFQHKQPQIWRKIKKNFLKKSFLKFLLQKFRTNCFRLEKIWENVLGANQSMDRSVDEPFPPPLRFIGSCMNRIQCD